MTEVQKARLNHAEFEPELVQSVVKLLKGKTLEEGAYILEQVVRWMKTNAKI